MITDLNIRKLALDFRKKQGLELNEPINVHNLLKKNNILTIFKKMRSDFSGMTVMTGKYSIVLINSGQTIGRQNFTILHEIYHIFYDKKECDLICENYSSEKKGNVKSEKNADAFASFLILPEDGLLSLIPENELSKNRISIKTILSIENHFQCSRAVLLNRLIDKKLIDSKLYQKFKSDVINEALLNGYDTSLYSPGNDNLILGDYVEIAKKLYDMEKISESNFLTYLLDVGRIPEEIQVATEKK